MSDGPAFIAPLSLAPMQTSSMDRERETIDLIGSAPADVAGVEEISGRRTFDKTVSRKPLAFAADAAAMGIDRCFGTLVPGLHGRVRQANWRCAKHPA